MSSESESHFVFHLIVILNIWEKKKKKESVFYRLAWRAMKGRQIGETFTAEGAL
jgi:hypothetical protein